MSNRLSVVTGGSGYVGYALLRELDARGENMRILIRKDSNMFDGIKCEKVFGDVTNYDSLVRAFEGAEIVYHVAGVVDITGTKDEMVWNVNYEGTRNVIEACKKCGVKTLIYVSSVDAIPTSEDMEEITEISKFMPGAVEGTYAKTKALSSQYAIDSADENLKICVVHPSCCIGPYDINNNSSVSTMLNLFVNGAFPVTFSFGGYNFVDVRDVAKGMVAAAEKGRNGECYILSGYAHTLKEFIKTLSKVCGEKPPKITLSKEFIIKILPALEKAFEALNVPPMLNEYAVRKLCENCNFSCEKARRELGYEPMTLEQSLTDTVAWMKEVAAEKEAAKEAKKEAEEEHRERFMDRFKDKDDDGEPKEHLWDRFKSKDADESDEPKERLRDRIKDKFRDSDGEEEPKTKNKD